MFWHMTTCSLVEVHLWFGGNYCLNLHGWRIIYVCSDHTSHFACCFAYFSKLKKTSLNFYQTTRPHIPKDTTLHCQLHEIFTYHVFLSTDYIHTVAYCFRLRLNWTLEHARTSKYKSLNRWTDWNFIGLSEIIENNSVKPSAFHRRNQLWNFSSACNGLQGWVHLCFPLISEHWKTNEIGWNDSRTPSTFFSFNFEAGWHYGCKFG
jgi:hypothetical protein